MLEVTRSRAKLNRLLFGCCHLVVLCLLLTGCELWSPTAPRLPNSGSMAVGETRTAYDVSTHCGVRVLGIEVAGIVWVATDLEEEGVSPIPPSWQDQVESERIDLTLELVTSEKLRVTALGTEESLVYAPAIEREFCR